MLIDSEMLRSLAVIVIWCANDVVVVFQQFWQPIASNAWGQEPSVFAPFLPTQNRRSIGLVSRLTRNEANAVPLSV